MMEFAALPPDDPQAANASTSATAAAGLPIALFRRAIVDDNAVISSWCRIPARIRGAVARCCVAASAGARAA
ncbi:hypothetical protein GCM10018954_046800 [Kutzneria kofuensis]